MRAVPPALALASVLATGCAVPANGLDMAPGQDCLQCHDGTQAKRWTAAGTWRPGSHVTITDAVGTSFTIRANGVGNFYTSQALTFPLTARAGGAQMPGPVIYGGCNRCHGSGGGANRRGGTLDGGSILVREVAMSLRTCDRLGPGTPPS
jgi:hypothetical protein